MVLAGVDVCMVPDDVGPNGFAALLKSLVLSGEVPQARIDEAVGRILALKFNLGLFEHPYPSQRQASSVGTSDHREIARRLVAESVVVLKNNQVLPLKAKTVLVTGRLADDVAAQCGGWTMGWQQPVGRIAGVTSVKAGIVTEAKARGINVITSQDGTSGIATTPDLAIVIAGEHPYAEFEGDKQDLNLDPTDRKLVQSLKQQGIRVLLVLISGRPLVLTDLLPTLDGLVAAWLPGSEGAGVSDVLFGDVKATGRLPLSWPRSNEQLPVNRKDGKKPLFDYGFGLEF